MLQRLALRDFRNFDRLELDVPATGLAIVGENGHGKTNLLEAISYLALLRSVRGARDVDVIRFGAPAFNIRADLARPARADGVSVGYERSTKRKQATLDGTLQPRLSDALGTLPSVCFSPVDVTLVAGGPAERRRYLDVTLALSTPRYLHALQQFRGALRQRNAALRVAQRAGARVGGAHDARVAVWEPALAQHGATLASVRRSWCDARSAAFTSVCAAIGERAPVTLRYVTALASVADEPALATDADRERAWMGAYQAAYNVHRAHELRRGVTLVGPHRDELQLSLGNRDLRTFGSAGQQRSAAIALRVLEAATLRDAIGATPLLLLDDPFAELDVRRSARILTLLEEAGIGQVVLAVPREADIPGAFTRLDRRIMVDGALQ